MVQFQTYIHRRRRRRTSTIIEGLQRLEFLNPKVLIYIQKETHYFGQKYFPIFFLNCK